MRVWQAELLLAVVFAARCVTYLLEMIGLEYMVTYTLLGLGFVMVAFTARKQGLHDKIFHTLVLKVEK